MRKQKQQRPILIHEQGVSTMPPKMKQPLKSCVIWPGGKSTIADKVWARFANVDNFIEPFAGSAAVLLRRPDWHLGGDLRRETLNDVNHYVCLAAPTRLLCPDLRWRAVGDMKIGDKLFGFDESNGERAAGSRLPAGYRKWRMSTVTGVSRVVKPCYQLTFSDGTVVISSEDHLWLVGTKGAGSSSWKWLETKKIIVGGGKHSFLRKIAPVVERENSWESGWLSGFFDGEGSVAAKVGWRMCLAQNQGASLAKAERLLSERGFQFTRTDRKSGCSVLLLLGGMRETLRLLQLIRPERLITNASKQIPGKSIYGRDHHTVYLVEREFLGNREVVALETDTHTFIAEGLASHNCNFHRAVAAAPDEVAQFADWPVTEADLHARHRWLVHSPHAAKWRKRMKEDPDAYDAKIAGWWVWGLALWIGHSWCDDVTGVIGERFPCDLTGSGVISPRPPIGERRPVVNEDGQGYGVVRGPSGQSQQRPHFGGGGKGQGVCKAQGGRPQLTDAFDLGRGVNATPPAQSQKIMHMSPHRSVISPHGTAAGHRAWLVDWMRRLSDRMRYVRTCYGHWSRICDSDSTLTRLGTTGVFLDPPYPTHRADNGKQSRAAGLYTSDRRGSLDDLRDEVLAWCLKWGGDPLIKVAVCCYEGDGYEPLAEMGWTVEAWSTPGGYSNQRKKGAKKSENSERERIFWSPGCVEAAGLFDGIQ